MPKVSRKEATEKAMEMAGVDEKEVKEKEPLENKHIALPTALKEIIKIYNKYLDTSIDNISLLSHWVLGTYFHSQFETFPIGFLLAQKQSGKTRTLKLTSMLCKDGDGNLSASLTETHLFRRKNKPAFFDEMESINNREQGNLRELLNASYKRGSTITRYKEKKKDFVEEVFSPFYPIMIANISGLNDVLSDRAIEIILRRSDKSQTLLIEDYQTNPQILNLKKELEKIEAKIPQNLFSQWNDHVQGIKIKDKKLIPFFDKIIKTNIRGRSLEIFFPLFIVAWLCEDLDDFLIIAENYVQKKKEAESVDNFDERLKEFIYAQQAELAGFVEIKSLVERFKYAVESPEAWLNSKWMAKALKRLDLISQKRLVDGKTQVRLKFNLNDKAIDTSTISTISTKSIITTNPIIPTKSTNKQVDNVEIVEINEQIDNKKPSQLPSFSPKVLRSV